MGSILLAGALVLLAALSIPVPPPAPAGVADVLDGDEPLQAAIARWKARTGARCKPSIRVAKSQRVLEARCSGEVVKRYVVNLGPEPAGDKLRQGDGRTPEGRLHVCNRNDRSQFHLFLGLSYPGKDDAARGETNRLVSAEQRRAIERAIDRGTCPPWGTALGGAVGIHGHGGFTRIGGELQIVDWTLGCVAVRDRDMDELWAFAPVGTPVDVEP